VQTGERADRFALVFVTGQQNFSFLQAALADAQIGQLEDGMDAQGLMAQVEGLDGVGEGGVGFRPLTAGRQQSAIGGAAVGGEERAVVALGVV
jgi:hypothetical protein